MCLAVPFEIKEIKGKEALADRAGIRRQIRVDFIRDLKPGDHVLVHAGFAIEKVEPEQAEQDLSAAQELAEELRKIALEIENRRIQRDGKD